MTGSVDSAGAYGVRLHAVPVLSYAMAYNRVPLVSGIDITCPAGSGQVDAELTLVVADDEGPLSELWTRPVSLSGPVTVRSVELVLDGGQVGQLTERRHARYECALTVGGEVVARTLTPVDVLAAHDWQAVPPGIGLEMLAAHVMPNAPEIGRLVDDASRLLWEQTGSPSVEGYQSGPERVDAIVRAVYETMQGRGIRYAEPPPSWSDAGQRIRTPADVLAGSDGSGGLATCLDTSLVLAAALEHAGVRPLLLLTADHACCGYWREETSLPLTAQQSTNELANRTDLGQVGLVETTGVCEGVALPWDEACTRAYGQLLRPPEEILGVTDVWTARRNQIIPLPAHSRAADGTPTVVAYQPEAHSAAPLERGARERQRTTTGEAIPPRFLQWQNALVDLSLRNPLLNLTDRTGIRVATPGDLCVRLEDRLSDGRRLVAWPYDGLGAVHDARTSLRSLADVDDDTVVGLFARSKAMVVGVSAEAYRTTFRALAYRARTVLEETGTNALHLTLGELVWSLDGRELRAPLVLVPVHVVAEAGEGRYAVVADDTGQPTANFALAEKLRQTHQLDLPVLEQAPTDEHGIDIEAVLRGVREALAEAGVPFRVEPAARLAMVQFAKFRLWRDIADHWQTMLASPLVRHLALTPTQDFHDPVVPAPVDLDALGALCPVPADASQVEAIGTALQGRTFVLEGPPGTGKSQTITNLLARAVADGQRVLFVAEKQAALEVVKRRLDDVGLSSISLDLHDKSAKPAAIRRQVQRALDLVADSDPGFLARTREEQAARLRPLARYVSAVHDPNGAGLSLYGAVAYEGPSDVEPLPVPESAVNSEAAAAISRARAAVRLVPDAADPVGPAPSPWGFATRASGADPAEVWAQAEAYEAALARTEAQPDPAWRAVFDACRTPGDAAAVGDLLGLADLSSDTVELACSPSWVQLLASLQREVSAEAARNLPMPAHVAVRLDLDGLLREAREAEGSFFLFRKRRLRRVVERLPEEARVDPERLVQVLEELLRARATADEVEPVVRDRLPNLTLPSGWHPWQPDAAAALTRAATDVQDRARAADPMRGSPELAARVRAALRRDGMVADPVREAGRALAEAMAGLRDALAIGDDAARRWSGAVGFGPQWRATAGRRALTDAGASSLRVWQTYVAQVAPLREAGLDAAADELLTGAADPDLAALSLESGLVAASVSERLAHGQLGTFERVVQDRSVGRFRTSSSELRLAERDALLDTALQRRTFAATAEVGRVGALRRDLARKRGGKSVRQLLSTYADLIAEIMPCALVSPDTVSRYYPVEPGLFDLVVFDEASQIKVADAIGAIARAKAVVVVGDSKQMPPTSFAEVVATVDEDLVAAAVADEESILTECVQAGLPRHWLSWHYRSQDESLIAFSNAYYYDGRLSSFPAPVRGAGDPGVDGHGVSLVRVPGEFLRTGKGRALRTNPVEAQAIVAAIKERFDAVPAGTMPSIGVVTFNSQQRALIEELLRDAGDDRLVAALESGHEGLFVKNLENVQGDERDVVMFSTAFSVNEQGVLPLNFGPLNLSGGERRLNVAITRARRQVLVFSSFDPGQLRAEETSSVGVRHLKAYLELAAAGSPLSALATVRRPVRDRHRDEIAAMLRAAGLAVSTDVGLSEFRVDLALARSDDPETPLVAVLLDSPGWARRRTVADRFELPDHVLEQLRWPAVEWVWLPEWLSDPDQVVERLVRATRTAAVPATEPRWEPLPNQDDDVEDPSLEGLERTPGGSDDEGSELVEPAESGHHSGDRVSVARAMVRPGRTELPGESMYVTWPMPDPRPRAVLDNLDDPASAALVAAVVNEIVFVEGPVHRDRVVSLAGRAFSLSRVSATRAAAILGTARERTGETWLWPVHIDPEAWRDFRRSSVEQRPFEHVPDAEVMNAMCAIASATRGAVRKELVKAALAVFGVNRRGSAAVRAERILDEALAQGRLIDSDGMLRVP